MLQDNPCGRLENEFQSRTAQPHDLVLCITPEGMAVRKGSPLAEAFPTAGKLGVAAGELQYLFRLDGHDFYLYTGENTAGEDYPTVHPRFLREVACNEVSFAAFTGWHLYDWYRNNRLCGRCGSSTRHDTKERMLRCDTCGNMIFPRINPAVIVAVTDGDRLLLTKYAGRDYTHYALIAGFTEIGETLEQTVEREVFEEVGVRVKNIRYYKSQPWGIAGNILTGFYCDLDGSDAITLDDSELSVGAWFSRDAIPIRDDCFSLTREMIRVFEEGKEPK